MLAASKSVTEMLIKFGFRLPCPTVGFWSSRELFLSQMWVTTHKVLFLSISPFRQLLSHNKFNKAWFAFFKRTAWRAAVLPRYYFCHLSPYFLLWCQLFQEHRCWGDVMSSFGNIYDVIKIPNVWRCGVSQYNCLNTSVKVGDFGKMLV